MLLVVVILLRNMHDQLYCHNFIYAWLLIIVQFCILRVLQAILDENNGILFLIYHKLY